jgi:hypothetical protein
MKPLEARFPGLYHDITSETPHEGGLAVEKRTPKKRQPTLHEVIEAVLQQDGITSQGLAGSLTECVTEFLGLKPQKVAPPPAAAEETQAEEEEAAPTKRGSRASHGG